MRVLFICLTWIALATGASAACRGNDLRGALSFTEKSQLRSRVAATPYAEGNRYIAERDGQIVHLIGTVHLDDPRLADPLRRLTPLIQSAGMVLVEMDESGQAELTSALSTRPDMLIMPRGSLLEMLPADTWDDYAEAVEARGVPAAMAARFQPWYAALLMSLPACLGTELTHMKGLDSQITDIANAARVPVRALEPFDTIFSLFASAPMDEQIDMLTAAIVPSDTTEDAFATVLASYFDERPAESWEVSRLMATKSGTSAEAFAAMENTILTRRNHTWIPVILSNLGHQPLVAAFGAAHLIGDEGIPALLEREGFTISRVRF